MEQYISKAAVVAEIENLLDKGRYHEEYDCAYRDGNNGALYALKNKLNNLEVKEVSLEDLKEELDKAVEIYKPDGDFGWGTLYNIAVHFFELGLKAKKGELLCRVYLMLNQRIDIANIAWLSSVMKGNQNPLKHLQIIKLNSMTDKEKLEKIKCLADDMYYKMSHLTSDTRPIRKAMEDYHSFIVHEYNKDEQVDKPIDFKQELYKAFGQVIAKRFYEMGKQHQEPISEDLEEASRSYVDNEEYDDDVYFAIKAAFKAGAKWQKTNLWKLADGDDLPEIDREVVAFQEIFPTDVDVPSLFKIVITYRPNPKGYDGKSIATGKVEHYTPKTYDKGGWNIPNIVYWLDVELPKEIEL